MARQSPYVCRRTSAGRRKSRFPICLGAKPRTIKNYSPNVRSNGKVIKRQDSKFSCCYGDEPGVGLGCKSNTVGDVVEPVTSSGIVRANGIWVQRHGDRCTLNNGNTVGEYVHVESTAVHPAPDGTDNEDQASASAQDTAAPAKNSPMVSRRMPAKHGKASRR
ncbi:PAAR-like domain-containing protein [Sinorhizobium sojae]|uniref:PAAR-like domain-containing protein n=1 Tax=Sinorhizobium sojae TaxID=716925 RepID=UPI0009FE95BF